MKYLLAVALLVLLSCQPAAKVAAPPTLTNLTPENFSSLKERFNEASDTTRIIALLSPT